MGGGAGDTVGGGAAGKALRSEGVLSGNGLRTVLSGRGVRPEPSGSGLRTFSGVGAIDAVGTTDAGTIAVMVPLEMVDEGLGVIEDLGPGDGREEGEELLVEDGLARWCDGAGFGGRLSISRTLSLLIFNLMILEEAWN